MKNELDSHLLLEVYQKVQKYGVEKDGMHELDGVKAYADADGYTVYLQDNLVTLRVGFHNKYHLNYDRQEHFDTFESRLHAINRDYQ